MKEEILLSTTEFPKQKVYIDEGLFERIHHGDQDAFRELYELSYKPLYAFLLSLTQNSEDAKDLLQDTFLQIQVSCHLYKKPGNPMAWMMKISKNLFLMKYRRESTNIRMNYDDMENELGFENITNVENRVLLEKMFQILSLEEQRIIVMHDVSGLKYREIADVTGHPLGTVLAKYNRGIRKLQKEFSKR